MNVIQNTNLQLFVTSPKTVQTQPRTKPITCTLPQTKKKRPFHPTCECSALFRECTRRRARNRALFPARGHRRRWVVLWSARECLTCTSVSSCHARFLTASSYSSSSPLLWVWVADDRGKWEMFEWERWESPCVRFRWGVALRTSNLLLAGRKEAAKQSKEKKGSACKFSFACAQFGPASRTRSSSKLEARYGKKLRESSRPREKKRWQAHHQQLKLSEQGRKEEEVDFPPYFSSARLRQENSEKCVFPVGNCVISLFEQGKRRPERNVGCFRRWPVNFRPFWPRKHTDRALFRFFLPPRTHTKTHA